MRIEKIMEMPHMFTCEKQEHGDYLCPPTHHKHGRICPVCEPAMARIARCSQAELESFLTWNDHNGFYKFVDREYSIELIQMMFKEDMSPDEDEDDRLDWFYWWMTGVKDTSCAPNFVPTTFEHFQQSGTIEHNIDINGQHFDCVKVYDPDLHIGVNLHNSEDFEYSLILGNQEFTTENDLESLERRLFEWAQSEGYYNG